METTQKRIVGRTGFVRSECIDEDEMLSQSEIELCKDWLLKFAKRKNRKRGEGVNSYYLKHVIEETISQYAPNGACIQAAIDLGYKYAVDDGPNAYFHMELLLPDEDWKRVRPRGFSKWLFKQEAMFGLDAKYDPNWPRTATRFIDFWRYLKCDGDGWVSEAICNAWEKWTGRIAPRPDFIDTDPVYSCECDFISYGQPYPIAPPQSTYLYALIEDVVDQIKEYSFTRIRVRYVGQTTSPTKRLRDHVHRPGSIDRVKWIGGLLNTNQSLRMAVFDTVAKSMADVLEKAAIYAFSESETRWDDELDGFPPLDEALLNVDK